MAKKVGILTAGSDCPGLNAIIRGFGKAARRTYGMSLVGFKDGFRGLMMNHTIDLGGSVLSNILTAGGTILGTSRDVPHDVEVDGKYVNKVSDVVEVYTANELDALVCIGGQETQEAALHLSEAGLNILTIPKSADNDVAMTDVTIGFDTARMIATDAIDRLHSTANSTHRIIIVEIMGREVGWLTLCAGIASGSDVVLIPEIPYSIDKISQAILDRSKAGKNFSIVAVAEGATSSELEAFFERSMKINRKVHEDESLKISRDRMRGLKKKYTGQTLLLANRLEETTGIDCRITILGYLQRGGTPSASDRLLATHLGTQAADLVEAGEFGKMVSYRDGKAVCVPLADVVGKKKQVPLDHPWIISARHVGTVFGD
ncbi:MAG: ATP-dependent 6-phosphofructokinase [Chloroflexota bacterium]|nr:ATP-dependent 6-phosphofructokinase [Chloroflexota bacterium]